MGTIHTGCRMENHVDRSRGVELPRLLVDTGGEYAWVPSRKKLVAAGPLPAG
jgi:hypothetical protein